MEGKTEKVEKAKKVEKISIKRGSTTEKRWGRRQLWFYWSCSCGDSMRYLNDIARRLGSERHADSHRAKKKGDNK